MKIRFSEKNRKIIFYIVVMISFAAIFIYNYFTPLMSDELQFDASQYQSLADIFKAEYANYMSWNGRSVVQFIMRCFLLMPKWVFNICNSICFVILMLLMYWNIRQRRKYDISVYILVNLMVWQFGVEFAQTILWVSGACNYLWGAAIILGFVTLYRYYTEHTEQIKHPVPLSIGLFVFGVLGGWCNENTSGGGFLLILFFAAVYYVHNRKLKPWMITGICGMLTGLIFMVMAPGNRLRGALLREEEEHSGIMAYVGRFLKINHAVETYLFMMLAVIIVLFVFFLLKGNSLVQMDNMIVYTVVSIATSYALIFTPQPMDRAYFGAGIFMIIAFVQAIWYIPHEEILLNAVRYGGIAAFTVFMFFSYCENGADLARIMREVNERDNYVQEQKAQGNYNLTVPMLRPEFETKYSFLYMNDVDEDQESWGCSIYRQYYGLESLVGISRENWTEY